MKLGFIGTGAITEAIVTGLVASDPDNLSIIVSPRNERVAARLADRFSSHVAIAAGNQGVSDNADIVMIAVRRQVVGTVLRSLQFRLDHLVVSLASELSIDDITPMVAHRCRARAKAF